MKRAAILALIALQALLAALPGAAQDQAVAACLFPTVGLTPESGDLLEVVGRALSHNLQQLGILILPEETWRQGLGNTAPEALLNGRVAAEVASRAGARMAVVSLIHVEDRQLSMSIKAVDARSGRVVSSVYATTLVGVAVHNRIGEAVQRLTPQLQSFLDPEQRGEEVAPFVIEAALLSDLDGIRISLGGVEPVGQIAGGRLTLPFALYPSGTRLEVLQEKEGYHPARETIVLEQVRSEVPLRPLWRHTRHSVHLSWTTGQILGMGLGYRYYLRPDYLFLAAENAFYLQPAPVPGAEGLAFHDDLGFLAGRYLLSPHDSPVRFALAAGLGLILTKSAAPGWFTDWYLNLMSLNLEYNRRLYTFGLRGDLKVTLGIGDDLLGTQVLSLQRFGPLFTLSAGRKL